MGMSEIIKKMKVFLQNEIPTEEIQVQMTDVKTKDGMILSFDGELKIGIEIFVVDEAGRNPAPDGEYQLEDGQILEVEGGIVNEIKAPEMPIEAPPMPVVEMPMAESGTTSDVAMPMAESGTTSDVAMEEVKLEDLACKVKKLEEDFTQLSTILSELATEMGKNELKSEIKQDLQLSKPKTIPQMRENSNTANSQLDNIFYNMYNKKI